MFQDQIKKTNVTLQKAISELISEGMRQELSNLKLLEGDRLKRFTEIFSIDEESEIYYNSFNILIVDPETHSGLGPFLKQSSLVFKLELPSVNVNLWAYSMFDDPLISNLFDDLEQ